MANSPPFLLDESVDVAVAVGMRARGLTATTARDVGRLGLSDEDQLVFAAERGFVLVTQDRDFVDMHWAGVAHGGIVYASKRTSVGTIVKWLVEIASVYSAEEFGGQLETVRRG